MGAISANIKVIKTAGWRGGGNGVCDETLYRDGRHPFFGEKKPAPAQQSLAFCSQSFHMKSSREKKANNEQELRFLS